MITRLVTILTLAIVITGCTGAPVAAPSASPSATQSESATPTLAPTPAPTATPPPDWSSLPEPALDPDTLARQLAFVESAIRDPNVTGAELAYVGHMQQLIIARLRDYPDWLNQVVAGLPAGSRDAVLGTYEAGRQLRMIPGPIPRKLPDWQILEAKPIDTLLSYYKEAQAKYGVEWQYLAAIHLVESRVGRIHGLSTAGAQGPMQFIPSTWAVYGTGDINDDHDSILAAARYLRAAGAPGDMRAALLAYNHSTAYVNALIAYATVLKAQPDEYRGYHGWQVYYTTQDGTTLLPVGWTKPAS